MKKVYAKMLTCMMIALLVFSMVSIFMPVKASEGISPLTYDELNFSFKAGCHVSRDVTGSFMDIRVRGTAANNNNETITLEIYIGSRNTIKTVTFLTDGQYHTYKNIYLGLSGGSDVRFTFRAANPEITINMYLEIGS